MIKFSSEPKKTLIISVIICLTHWINPSSAEFKFNITNLDNCLEFVDIAPVTLVDVTYDYIDGYCDTIHGSYYVRVNHRILEYELWIIVYQCPTGTVGPCQIKKTEIVEALMCERFHSDSSGPWFWISSAMDESTCGRDPGEYPLKNAQMKRSYLTNYIEEDPENSHYRLQLKFHEKRAPDNIVFRGCADLEFDIFY